MAGESKVVREIPSVDELQKQVSTLESRVAFLDGQLKAERAKKSRSRGWRVKDFFRRLAVILLVVFTALFLNTGLAAVWVKRNVVDTDRWVSKTTQMITNPDTRAAISNALASEMFEQIDVQQYVTQIFPEQISSLAAPLTNSLESYTAGKINQGLNSEAFLTFWANANRSAHDGIIKSLENGGVATDDLKNSSLMYIDQDKLLLNLKPVFVALQTKLADAGLGFVNRIDPNRMNKTITLTEIDNLPAVLAAFNLMNKIAIVLPLLGIASAIGAIALARNKRRVLMAVGAVTALFMVMNVQLIFLARYPFINDMANALTSAGTAAADATYSILTSDLVVMSRTLMAASLIIVLAGFLTGPSGMAIWIRKKLGRLFVFNKPDAPVPAWIGVHANQLVVGLAVLALILLLFPLGSGPAYSISIVVVTAVLCFGVLSVKMVTRQDTK